MFDEKSLIFRTFSHYGDVPKIRKINFNVAKSHSRISYAVNSYLFAFIILNVTFFIVFIVV